MARPIRILCTGDVHIGRRPAGVPQGQDQRRWSCAAMWEAIVDLAILRRVDLVAVSGDIVDRENRFYEAYGPLERGLRKLSDAGIETVAVSGNHDFDVLPKLADELGVRRLRLVGRDGKWERVAIRREGRIVLHVDGWSFPAERVLQSPLCDYKPTELAAHSNSSASNNTSSNGNGDSGGAAPVLGLLHADLDQAQSCYGPVMLADLRRHGLAMWLLGHIHKPAWRPREAASPAVLYPGSPQAMDFGESGVHGPWLLEIGPGPAAVSAMQIPLSRVRYETLDVDLSEVPDERAFATFVPRKWNQWLDGLANNGGPIEFVASRLRLVGRTALHRRVNECCKTLPDLEGEAASFKARIDRVINDTRPPIDLNDLSRGGDMPALLARLILELRKAENHSPTDANGNGNGDGETSDSDGNGSHDVNGNVATNGADGASIGATKGATHDVDAATHGADGSSAVSASIASLLSAAAQRTEEVYSARAYHPIAADPLPNSAAQRERLLRQGYGLLDELLAQREDA